MSEDYSGKNLSGRSFKGQNLTGANFSSAHVESTNFSGAILIGANFSSAHIESTNFSGAILIRANFSDAEAGLERRRVIFAVAVAVAVAIAGAIAGTIAIAIAVVGAVALLVPVVGTKAVAVLVPVIVTEAVAEVLTKAGAVAVALAEAVALAVLVPLIGETIAETFAGTALVALAGIVPVAGAVAIAVIGAVAVALAGAVAIAGAVALVIAVALAVAIAEAVFRTGIKAVALTVAVVLVLAVVIVEAGAVVATVNIVKFVVKVGVLIGTEVGSLAKTQAGALAGTGSVVVFVAGALILFSTYIIGCALTGDQDDTLIKKIVINFTTFGGTNFQNADLTDANFTGASLKGTDFRNAILTRTSFHKTKKLDRVSPGSSYLQIAKVRQIVMNESVKDKNFDRLDLRGINFKGANLVDASFISADLSLANLQDADLSGAKLVQAQLDGTDFTGATLTGAYIKDWNITSDTKFDGVRCKYVYMRLPTDEDPLRKPDNRQEVFADGEFGDFIKPIFDTLDLYHSQGVDPRAIAISFKQLAENHPEAELRIVGMEVKGENKFLLRAKTADTADKSELSKKYFTIYNELKALAQQEVKALMAEKDSRIANLENMVVTALQSPSFYAETYNNRGDTMPRKESHFDLQGAQFAGGLVNAETVNADQIGGNIYNQSSQQSPELVKTILILASNPRTTSTLRLDEEVREIGEGLQRAKKRDLFDLKQRWAVRVQDVYQSLLDFKPQIVHFSGHGSGGDGLVLEDENGEERLVDTGAIAQLFELFANRIECVVLNACYSEVQAGAIAQHIPYVIGMNQAIGDKAAIKFATGFYSTLGAGESVEFAYKLGCSVIQLDGIAEYLTPVLRKKSE